MSICIFVPHSVLNKSCLFFCIYVLCICCVVLFCVYQAIRRQCDSLTNAVESLQSGISDKIDRNIAELIVQKKYEDIVQYLQDALTATGEDEDNFKNMALELDEKLKKLASSKSDRLEIQPIQDSLVKVEASISKLLGDKKDNRRENDFYSKAQVEELLYEKVDKESLEEFVNSVIKNRRGKASRLSTSGSNIGPNSAQFLNDNSVGSKDSHDGQMKMSQSMSSLKGNRHHQQQQTLHTTNMNKSLDVQVPQYNETIAGKHRPPKGGFPTTQPGKFRQGSEKGIPGGSKEIMHQQEMERSGIYNDSGGGGRGGGAGGGGGVGQFAPDPSYGGPPRGPPKNVLPQGYQNGEALSTGVVPGRGLQPEGVPQGVFPPINVPGRSVGMYQEGGGNKGGGRGGGQNEVGENNSSDAFDFIGGATKGGGFNSRSPTKVIADPNALSAGISDINAKNEASLGKVPIVGHDGHFYQSDQDVEEQDLQQHSSIINPVLNNIEVAPLQPTPSHTPSPDQQPEVLATN